MTIAEPKAKVWDTLHPSVIEHLQGRTQLEVQPNLSHLTDYQGVQVFTTQYEELFNLILDNLQGACDVEGNPLDKADFKNWFDKDGNYSEDLIAIILWVDGTVQVMQWELVDPRLYAQATHLDTITIGAYNTFGYDLPLAVATRAYTEVYIGQLINNYISGDLFQEFVVNVVGAFFGGPKPSVSVMDSIAISFDEAIGTLKKLTKNYQVLNKVIQGFDNIMLTSSTDNTNPSHYRLAGIETIDLIDLGTKTFSQYILPELIEENMELSSVVWVSDVANVIKYTHRGLHKGSISQDFNKSVWYVEHAKKTLLSLDNGRDNN